jgi:type I restriction enzyme S subunit
MNADQLLKHFERISEAPDAVARLRRFVLDLAVRGKLVAQLASEGSGSNVLEDARKSKRALAETRGIRLRNAVEYSEYEAEWDVPSNWVLAFVDDVAIVQGGKRLPKGATFA